MRFLALLGMTVIERLFRERALALTIFFVRIQYIKPQSSQTSQSEIMKKSTILDLRFEIWDLRGWI
ncbi:MAG: hypothetical protein AYP45_09030 [Candidatus Brocadia carolinensis]|uniref:Uncharacterized protein n=1 Tax=Candidatus Brocadia carolinensis TaxID=1004156 RepID=A0A1V4ATI7_9BACT|nr:MAG: hypothetical protein AYP45_09030 [Candidatus Brocadia caroliniensis]